MPTRPKKFRPPGAPAPEERRRAFDAERNKVQKWRRLYADTRWRRLRLWFLNHNPLCVDCKANGKVTASTDVDHIVPHRGDMGLFWDRDNLQALCHECHSRKTGKGM